MSRTSAVGRFLITLAILIFVIGGFGTSTVQAAGVVGNGTQESCNETAFNNALNGGGSVTFNCGPDGALLFISGIKEISADTTIDGANLINLVAQNTYHFQVSSTKKLVLKNLVLAGGSGNVTGAIENFGTTKLVNVYLYGNNSDENGGAITNYGKLRVNDSYFFENYANVSGGAIWNEGGNVKVKNTSFRKNEASTLNGFGGAIGNAAGKVVVIGSTLFKSKAATGAGIWTDNGTTNVLKQSTLDKNKGQYGGGIANFGSLEIVLTTLSRNKAAIQGGGVYNAGSMSLTQSTISGSKAETGAGIRNFGLSMLIDRSTLSGNNATNQGGGVFNSYNATLKNSTLSGNNAGPGKGGGGWFQYTNTATFEFVTIANNGGAFGGGIYADGSSPSESEITLRNTVLSSNSGGNCGGATLTSLGYNLSNDTFCGSVLTGTGDQSNIPSGLAGLTGNGGSTQTHHPLAGSQLINKGINIGGITTDQRGLPRQAGPKPDIGAVEVQ